MISLQDQILTEMNHQEFNSTHQLVSILHSNVEHYIHGHNILCLGKM